MAKQPIKRVEMPVQVSMDELRRGRGFNMSYGKMIQWRNRHARQKAKKAHNHVVG
jgi:hypothetical protein